MRHGEDLPLYLGLSMGDTFIRATVTKLCRSTAVMSRLAAMVPDVYASETQLRTLQRRIKVWRAERVRELVLGSLRKSADTPIGA